MSDYLASFMEKLNFPQEAKAFFMNLDFAIEQDPNIKDAMNSIIARFYSDPEYHQTDEIFEELNHLAKMTGVHRYSMHFIFFMYCSKLLLERYRMSGIPEDIFWNTMSDLNYKLIECHNVYGIWGTFVGSWFRSFYHMKRFGLGRLQYEHIAFAYDKYTHGPFMVHKGDVVYNVHIPSSGPLTRDKRMASYKKAYEFYKDELSGRLMTFVCNSWLLYPKNVEFFPKNSNIVDFMHDFEIIGSTEQDTFSDAWRVFGKDYEKPIEKLPVATSLQRAFVKWMEDGNKTGYGYGVMLFDGEKIV